MPKKYFQLSDASIESVKALCATVRQRNPKNPRSIEIAEGIGSYVEEHAGLTDGQANWVCHNADYMKIKRPAELANIKLEKSGGEASAPDDAAADSTNLKIAAHFRQLAGLLVQCETGQPVRY